MTNRKVHNTISFDGRNSWLYRDKKIIHYLLEQTRKIASQYFDQQEKLPPGMSVKKLSGKQLPEQGVGTEAVLNYFSSHYEHQISNTAGPRYFGFVTGGSTPASVAADWLVSVYDQNVTGSLDSIAPQIEHQTIDLLKQLFSLKDEFFGMFVTGATMSNMVGLASARQWVGEQRGRDYSNEGLAGANAIRVLSGTPHSSIIKSMSMIGIGRNALTLVPTVSGREAIDVFELENHLRQSDGPVIVVANAGTVNTVDFDDFEAIAALKEKYSFWLHVDGAFGSFAACSEKYAHLTQGINAADSITIDAHKWLNVPYDSAMHFTRHKKIQGNVFRNQAAYLGGDELGPDFLHYTPENSRRFRALPAWFSLLAYGKSGIREIVERNVLWATKLGDLISNSNYFRLLAPVRLNVVCFTLDRQRLSMKEVQEFLASVSRDGRAFFSPTVYFGQPAVRAAFSNWQTEEKDVEIAYQSLSDVYRKHFKLN